MPASRSARQRKAGAEAGPLAEVRIDVSADDSFTSKHPDAEAPCLVHLPEARARLQQRRDARG